MKAKIMIGCPGSGKSTYSSGLKDYVIISQDDQGSDHYSLFLSSIQNKLQICVDRMGFNRSQRDRYIKPLLEAGYDVEIVELPVPKDLLQRLKNRTNHPTVKDYSTAFKALKTFFMNYEPTVNSSIDNFYLKKLKDKNAYVFGDIHGEYNTLKAFLVKINYNPAIHTLIFAGDLTDRGPKNKEVLEFVISTPNVHLAIGNHDIKLIKWLFSYLSGEPYKGKLDPHFQDTIAAALEVGPERLLSFYLRQSHLIEIGNNYVFHAGVNPQIPIKSQNKEMFLYCSCINPADMKMEVYEGKEMIHPRWFTYDFHPDYENTNLLFGHSVLDEVDYSTDKVGVFALDAGLWYTGKLRAAHILNGKLSSINTYNRGKPMWIEPYLDLVNKKLLSMRQEGDLVLFDYTEKCTYEKEWNDITLNCRGTIFEKETGRVVAKTMPKFFNLNEMGMTADKLPNERYEVFEKVDGSMISIFNYDNTWRTATRGSFNSDQAIKARSMLSKYDLTSVPTTWTLICEVIYPENQIVVDYGQEEKLVLLTVYDNTTGLELNSTEIASVIKMEHAKKYHYTVNELIKMKTTIPKDEEGWVVKFANGLRVKIKGDEYLTYHRFKSNITPLFIWELLKDDKVTEQYLQAVPEEYLESVQSLINRLNVEFNSMKEEVYKEYETIQHLSNKELGILVGSNSSELKHPKCMFTVRNSPKNLAKFIWEAIRPKGNVL